VSGSGIGWAICKSAPRSRQITMPAPHHSLVNLVLICPCYLPMLHKHVHVKRKVLSYLFQLLNNSYCCLLVTVVRAAGQLCRITTISLTHERSLSTICLFWRHFSGAHFLAQNASECIILLCFSLG